MALNKQELSPAIRLCTTQADPSDRGTHMLVALIPWQGPLAPDGEDDLVFRRLAHAKTPDATRTEPRTTGRINTIFIYSLLDL